MPGTIKHRGSLLIISSIIMVFLGYGTLKSGIGVIEEYNNKISFPKDKEVSNKNTISKTADNIEKHKSYIKLVKANSNHKKGVKNTTKHRLTPEKVLSNKLDETIKVYKNIIEEINNGNSIFLKNTDLAKHLLKNVIPSEINNLRNEINHLSSGINSKINPEIEKELGNKLTELSELQKQITKKLSPYLKSQQIQNEHVQGINL